MKDYYQTLEVPPNASQEKIKEQYRFLVHAWHPDKFPSPAQKEKVQEKIKEINEAYEVLSNATKRAQYDRERSGSWFYEDERRQEKARAEAEQRRTEQEQQQGQRAEEERRRAEAEQRRTKQEQQEGQRAEEERRRAEEERQRAEFERQRKAQTEFAGMTQTWIAVLTKPGEEIFEQEQASPRASLSTALIWTVLAAVVTAVLGFIQSLAFASSAQGMMGFIDQMNLPPESAAMIQQMMGGGAFAGLSGAGAFLGIILSPLFFLIGVGIIHLIAKMLRGQGDFGRFAYLAAAIQSPISIVNAFLGFIPVVGGCVIFLLSIYSLILFYFAIKVAYQLTSGRAIAVVLIPIVIVIGLALCIGFAIASFAVSLGN